LSKIRASSFIRAIQIALRIFDDLGGLGNFDGGSPKNSCGYHRLVNLRNNFEGFLILSGNYFLYCGKGMFFVSGVDSLRAVAYSEILAAGQP
jgi:hypothetical protein